MQETESVQVAVEGEAMAGAEAVRAPTDEWTAASLAHASILLTVILSGAGGIGAFIGPVIPLAMFFGYRERSRFVAFHALQAFVYQIASILIGVPVYGSVLAMLIVSTVLAWVVSIILMFVLVGFLLMPFALLLTLLAVAWGISVPIVWLGYGLYAAYQTYQGRNFHYWLIGEWLEKEVKA